jgi:predicted GNAT family acetyltransferase
MDLTRCATAQEFLDATYDVRAAEPLRTNVFGSVAGSVATGLRNYDAYFWWLLHDEDRLAGFAMRTVPHGLLIGPMSVGAAEVLGSGVARDDAELPSVTGSSELVTSFLGGLAAGGVTRASHAGRTDVLYAIDELNEPTVDGAARLATKDDLDLVMKWGRAFHDELEIPTQSDQSVRPRLDAGAFFLWTVDGTPVSMAGHAEPVASPGAIVARVGPVYTPAHERGHGYAAGATAAVTRELMVSGHRVMLFADAANPISNGVYQRLGYYRCDEVVHYDFD